MKNNMVELLLVLQLISVCSGLNPCVDYVFMNMADGRRSSDFYSRNSEVSLCDAHLDPATWYRFEHEAGNRLIERPVEPWYCGTQAPIWLYGTHPTDKSEVTASVCATFSSEIVCGWNGTIRIRLCNESESEYFVYQLAVPPGCPLAYCVDATTREQCIPPDVWLDDEFRCGGLVVTEYIDPATIIEDNNGEDNEVACPSLTCVLPIVLSVTVVVLALVIGGFCFAKNKLKPRTEPDASPSPEPPHYKEVLSKDIRVSIKGLPYMVQPLPPIVSRNVYDTLTEPGSMDFQKRDLDV